MCAPDPLLEQAPHLDVSEGALLLRHLSQTAVILDLKLTEVRYMSIFVCLELASSFLREEDA